MLPLMARQIIKIKYVCILFHHVLNFKSYRLGSIYIASPELELELKKLQIPVHFEYHQEPETNQQLATLQNCAPDLCIQGYFEGAREANSCCGIRKLDGDGDGG